MHDLASLVHARRNARTRVRESFSGTEVVLRMSAPAEIAWNPPKLLLQNTQRIPLGCVMQAGVADGGRLPKMSLRRHDFYAVVLVVEGVGTFEAEPSVREPVEPGDLIVLCPGVRHRYTQTAGERWGEFWAIFEGPLFDSWRVAGLLDASAPVLRLGAANYWLKRFQAAVAPQRGGLYEQTLRRLAAFQVVLADSIAHARERRMDTHERAWLDEAYRLIEPQTSPAPPDWHAVAGKLGLSYEGFRKRFARLTGVPPAKHRANRTMDRACEMLRQGLSVAEVAQRCGFYDAFHFSRQFKKSLGVTPRDYRQRFGGG
jgi:AraC-like DNA-binding protein